MQHLDDAKPYASQAVAMAASCLCGSPMVSIAGGEPLIHKEMSAIVKELIERKKFIYLLLFYTISKSKFYRLLQDENEDMFHNYLQFYGRAIG